MREYRKRKRLGKMDVRASLSSMPPVVSAPEDLTPNTGLARKAARSRFKTALDLARTFPPGVLASQVCPYRYNSGYSSPGTQCSYCRSGER